VALRTVDDLRQSVWRGRSRRTVVDQMASLIETRGANAVRQESVIANAHKPFWDDVKQEAAQELARSKVMMQCDPRSIATGEGDVFSGEN
jgi:hypothetical protein